MPHLQISDPPHHPTIPFQCHCSLHASDFILSFNLLTTPCRFPICPIEMPSFQQFLPFPNPGSFILASPTYRGYNRGSGRTRRLWRTLGDRHLQKQGLGYKKGGDQTGEAGLTFSLTPGLLQGRLNIGLRIWECEMRGP